MTVKACLRTPGYNLRGISMNSMPRGWVASAIRPSDAGRLSSASRNLWHVKVGEVTVHSLTEDSLHPGSRR